MFEVGRRVKYCVIEHRHDVEADSHSVKFETGYGKIVEASLSEDKNGEFQRVEIELKDSSYLKLDIKDEKDRSTFVQPLGKE